MSKFRALILTMKGPAVFDLGQHEDFDRAAHFARGFCERKNEENRALIEKARADAEPADRERIEDLPDTEVVWILDSDDFRRLAGTVMCPLVIAKEKKEPQAVEAPVRHGGEDDAGPAEE